MEVPFPLEQEARLAKTAALAGTNAPGLVKEAALRLLEEDREFIAAEEMDARFANMLRS